MVIQEISIKHKNYPESLSHIHQPPQVLYVRGNLPAAPMISIVGTRRPTTYGKEVTYQLAYECAQAGFTIVSGLAIGLDTFAHEAALDAGGSTVAVLANGPDHIYPASNHQLAERIVREGGAVISEYPSGTPPMKHQFIARNRIVAGMSEAVIVTEAQASSGTLITANFALQENRMVMAVPGNITSLYAAGPNNLLRNGAVPVTSSSDIINSLGYENIQLEHKPGNQSKEEELIIGLINEGYNSVDQLIAKTDLNAASLASCLSLMEISGKVRNLGAGQWSTSNFDKR